MAFHHVFQRPTEGEHTWMNGWRSGGPCPPTPPGQPPLSLTAGQGRAGGFRHLVLISTTSSDLRRPSCNPSGHKGIDWASCGPAGFLAPFSTGPSPGLSPSPYHENQGPSLFAPAGALGPKPPALCTLADLILVLGTTYPAPMGQGHTVSPSAPLRRVGMASSTVSATAPLLS